jgi:hypothetical protein
MSSAEQASILNGWHPERKFAQILKKKTGYGSVPTLRRWKRVRIPDGLEYKTVGRAGMWREKPEPSEK